jgi:pimeloyl-ACP methyl ester carboxylesterase
VITGKYDFICGPACAEDIASGITGSTKIVLDDCGHFSFIEQPDAFRKAVASFLT